MTNINNINDSSLSENNNNNHYINNKKYNQNLNSYVILNSIQQPNLSNNFRKSNTTSTQGNKNSINRYEN